ncbi:hypothetical protein D3C76_975290 [compost metagenome]
MTNAACQPYSGIIKYAMRAAAIHPMAQKLSSNTTARPRSFTDTDSDTNVDATGSSPPSPIPDINRSTQSTPNPVASADNPLAIEKINNVHSKMALRP